MQDAKLLSCMATPRYCDLGASGCEGACFCCCSSALRNVSSRPPLVGGARIFALLQAGVTRAKDLIEQSGVGKTRAYEVLTELVEAELVIDGGHGQWALAPTPTRAVR